MNKIHPIQWFAKQLIKPLHSSKISGRRINRLSRLLIPFLDKHDSLSGLDVGCGNGRLARDLMNHLPNLTFIGVDVLLREETAIKIFKFDGATLPFESKSFDFILLIDVLHHTTEPHKLLKECSRVAKHFILIKDHYCDTWWDRIRLSFMDWVGNRAYGVPLPYNYLSRFRWKTMFKEAGLIMDGISETLSLYPQPFSFLFDSSLHFIANFSIT